MSEIKKNTLSIKLLESAVFLRTADLSGRNRHNDSQPSLLRGLLTLELVKPTRITSIELELQAKAYTSWPEGIGARRIDISEEHKVFSATSVLFRAGNARRRTSVGPGTLDASGLEEIDDDLSRPSRPVTPTGRDRDDSARPATRESRPPIRPFHGRRISADSSIFHRSPLAYHESHEPPIPPYSPHASFTTTPTLSPTHSTLHLLHDSPAQTLEDLRNALRADLSETPRSPQVSLPPRSRSRRPSFEDVPENGSEAGSSTVPAPVHHSASVTPSDSFRSQSRGRKRFSLSSVSNVLLDAVRSSSPRGSLFSKDTHPATSEEPSLRGRTMEKGKSTSTQDEGHVLPVKIGLSIFGKHDGEDNSGDGRGWKEFKKGIYTYPISFSIPGHAPPSLVCQYGSVVWRVKAGVHRPGPFNAKLAAQREIVVVTCPTEEDTEDTENILVERLWDQQMQYLIAISGRSFHIGGIVPVTFTIMPFAKIKIHRIAVYLEERVEYYTQFKKVARSEPVNRLSLLSLKHEGGGPILPLESDDPNVFKDSPLYPGTNSDEDISEMASSLMGPGPYTFHRDLRLPRSCRVMHFTNKNKRSNITVAHNLKLVMRVERGDDNAIDEKTGKRKLFDIVVQSPVLILSCRCDPDWTSLPHYSESFEDPASYRAQCPCMVKGDPEPHSQLERMASHRSSDSASSAETHIVNPGTMPSLRNIDSLLQGSTQYERLVSGQESEVGEAPPGYFDVM